MSDYLEIPESALVFDSRFKQLEYALSIRPAGVCAEFGVYKGKSARLIGKAINPQKLYAFDSFRGLPEKWQFGDKCHEKGHFNLDGKIPKLTKNTIPVVGRVEDTLPKWVADLTEPVAFVHVDTDLYAPCKVILNHLKPVLAKGAIIVFDELADFKTPQYYTLWREGEYRALIEEIPSFEYISRTTRYQVAIRV